MRYPVAQLAMLALISSHIPPLLRSPRTIAVVGLGAATALSLVWYHMTREQPSEADLERERRDYLAATGRIVDGSITETRWANEAEDATPITLIYRYRIAGVTYECAQDVRPLADFVRHVRIDLPIQVRFDPRNPGDSIVVAETWSGLRIDHEHPPAPPAFRTPPTQPNASEA
jgi:hypothetical protein